MNTLAASGTVQLLGLVLLASSALAACCSAVFSYLSIRKNSKNTEARLFLDLKDRYNAEDMKTALRELSKLALQNNGDFVNLWLAGFRTQDKTALALDKYRRDVSSYYTDISYLLRARYVSKELVQLLLRDKGISVFLKIVEPMERALIPGIDTEIYDRLRPLVPSHNTEFHVYPNLADGAQNS